MRSQTSSGLDNPETRTAQNPLLLPISLGVRVLYLQIKCQSVISDV